MTSLSISEVAAQSIVHQADYYREHAGADLVARWNNSIASTLRLIAKLPEITARRHFPYHFVFYFYDDLDGLVRIVHVVHGTRDLESVFGEAIRSDGGDESR